MTGEIQAWMSEVLLPVCKWLALGCLGVWLWLSFASAVRRQLAKLRRVASPFAALVMVLALAKFFEVGATKTNGVDRVSGGVLDAEAQRSKGRRAPAGISALESLDVRRTAVDVPPALWPIPNMYRRAGEKLAMWRFCDTDQSFTLEPDGTVYLEKFGYIESCTTNREFRGWIRTNQ